MLLLLLGFTMAAKAESGIELKWTEPSAGETYSTAASEGNVSFVFDGIISDLTASKIYIVLPDGNKVDVIDYSFTDAFYTIFNCHIGSQITSLAAEGRIRQGDEFKVRMEGLRRTETGETYGNNGVCEVSLLMGALPVELVSTSVEWGGTIPAFSRVDPTSDEGKVVFTFTDAVTVDSVTYGTGGREDATYVEIPLPCTINGSEVTVNLQGIALDPASLGVDKSYMNGTIRLNGVRKASDGSLAKGGQGSEGTISLFVNLSETISESIYGGIECPNIDKSESLTLYATEKFFFDHVQLVYKVNGSDVAVLFDGSHFEGIDLGEDGYEYHIPLTDFTFDAGDVTVSVSNPRSAFNQSFTFQPWTFSSEGRKAAAPKVLVAEPGENAIVSTMPNVNLTFNEAVTIESAVLSNADLLTSYALHELQGAAIRTSGIQTSITAGFNEYGHMTLKLRAKNADGAYVTHGEEEGCVTLHYYVRQDGLYLASSIPAKGEAVDSLKTIALVFECTNEGDVIGGFALNASARLLTPQGEEVAKGSLATAPDNYLGVIVTLDTAVTASGTYVLVIDEKMVFNNGYNSEDENYGVGLEGWDALYNLPVSVSFEVTGSASGIETVGLVPANGESTVLFDLGGRRVLKPAKGMIYVKNGIKTMWK